VKSGVAPIVPRIVDRVEAKLLREPLDVFEIAEAARNDKLLVLLLCRFCCHDCDAVKMNEAYAVMSKMLKRAPSAGMPGTMRWSDVT
jgi:hypothetical protein